jgi:subtilisin family serine protease
MRSSGVVLTAAFLVALAACDAFDPVAPGTGPENPQVEGPGEPFIVTIAGTARAADVARRMGVEPDFVYSHVLNGFAARLPAAALEGLSRNPHVERIEPDVMISVDGVQTDATWGLDRVDQRGNELDGRYQYDLTGAGVTVYVVDTGILYSHRDFGGRAVFGFDAYDGDGVDCHGHGTHVAGTIGSATYGIAKGVKLVGVRVLNCSGAGFLSRVVAGLDWAASQGAYPAVINMSLGGSANATLDDAVRRAVAVGITVVAAAGNSNADACDTSPARLSEAITVGATEATDARASFSNFGPCVDIFAPGRSITSTYFSADDAVATMSGTSMAAPHVAGAAALILHEAPGASPASVAAALAERATLGVVSDARSENNHLLHTLGTGVPGSEPDNAPPTAAFEYSCQALECSFSDASVDPDGEVVKWQWSFGDGSSASTRNPEHTFSHSGTFRVTLTVTDDAGAMAGTARDITVEAAPNSPPTAQFNVSCNYLECAFYDDSVEGDGSISHWDWDFGDGSSAASSQAPSNPMHAYGASGTYQVRLTVTDDQGLDATTIRAIEVDGIALFVERQKLKGRHSAVLTWSGSAASTTDILVNGAVHDRVASTGHYVFESDARGKGHYAFRVCDTGTDRCSVERVVTF